jgi:hypothetical protein
MMRTAGVTLLLALGLATPAQAYRLEHTRWYSHTITYYNTLPRYKQAVAAAARTWNRSGAKVRWKAVSLTVTDDGRNTSARFRDIPLS